MKKGKRTYGAIYDLPSGKRCYLAWRRIGEVFRGGEKTNSDAVRAGTAAWAIDEETLIQMRAKGVEHIGVLVRETGDVYLSTLDRFMDRTHSKVMNFVGRGGALQRYLPITAENFAYKPGRVKV